MDWKVEIYGEPRDLDEIAATLKTPEVSIVRDGERFFLRSSRFEPDAADSTIEVLAAEILLTLNGAARLAFEGHTEIRKGCPVYTGADGRTVIFSIIREEWRTYDRAWSGTLDAAGNLIEQSKPSDSIPKWLALGLRHERVATVLGWWGQQEHTWFWLYKIFEVIKHDCGGGQTIEQRGWMSKADHQRFTRTANHPKASGDAARHGHSSETPPPSPLSIAAARALIESLLHHWLNDKVRQEEITDCNHAPGRHTDTTRPRPAHGRHPS